jgi:E3 ubiquitin-protein ligase HERC4
VNEWGQLFSWGSNNFGQCGHENESSSVYPVPKLVKSLATKQIIQISCGQFHSLALTNSGEIYGFGSNIHGQLGLGFESEKVNKPTLIKSLSGIPISFICCGGNHSFALSKSGAVFGFGKNLFGQLGVNDQFSKCFPTQLRTLRSIGVKFISCGDDFSVFLTHDGGVFTCGNGAFGQLGHGNYSNEILPRKVMELMGSTITQISCGRRHTLTMIPSRKRVYGFGLGGSGQLGRGKDFQSSSVPHIVNGPWVTPSNNLNNHNNEDDLIIKCIYAGGDHCLVAICNSLAFVEDFRERDDSTQIWTLSKEISESCSKIEQNESVDMELISIIEIVFKNVSCFNASFLLKDNNQYLSCTSKYHGVNLEEASDAFDLVRKITHENLKTLIWDSITNDLLTSLTTKPPDVETLRIYLILPLYHEFVNSKNYSRLHTPFCKMLLGLEKVPKKIISGWYAMTSVEYFERLVDIFRDVVKYFLHFELSKIQIQSNRQVNFENNFCQALNMMSFLHYVNHQERKEKVPYEVFHVPEITDYFEIRQDYISWCMDQNLSTLYLCNYPFIFDATAKHTLLQTDQAIKMQTAMQEAAASNILTTFFGVPANVFIVLNVTRDNIVHDTIRELSHYNRDDLKKPLKVKFAGEEGEDAGGVRKEFFMLLLKDILDAKYGMFKCDEDSRAIWFSEDSFESEEMYKLVGILCGLAIYNFTIINIPFPLALYKKLLHEKPDMTDLKEFSPKLANTMQNILDYEGDDMEDVMMLNFIATRTYFGEERVYELKPNGANIPVNQENK